VSLEVQRIGSAVLYLGDALECLDALGPGRVDAVMTDPPYSSGGAFRGDRTLGTKAKYMNSDSGNLAKLAEFTGDTRDQRSFTFWCGLWSSACLRVAKLGAPGLFFTDWRQLPATTDYFQAGGWIWRGVVPWVKRTARPQMGRFMSQCEFVVWGSAGPMPFERGVGCLPGFFDYASPQDREHVTQKPVDLMADMMRIVEPGGVVLDPFMGAGTTGVAAVASGRSFIGCELMREHFDTACKRLEAAQAQGVLQLGDFGIVSAQLSIDEVAS